MLPLFDILSPKNRPELSESCTAVANVPIHKYYKTLWRKGWVMKWRAIRSFIKTLLCYLSHEKMEVKQKGSNPTPKKTLLVC